MCVDSVITDICLMDIDESRMKFTRMAPGVSVDELKSKTGCDFRVELGD